MSRGLEARVIEAVRLHLATDVAVGSGSLSLWSVWPDVEVILQDVRVEDAIERGQDFVQLEELGLRMGWWPLLEGRLDVRALRLQGGRLRVHRTCSGQENWVFWTDRIEIPRVPTAGASNGSCCGMWNWKGNGMGRDNR